jgi:hypothetical protein
MNAKWIIKWQAKFAGLVLTFSSLTMLLYKKKWQAKICFYFEPCTRLFSFWKRFSRIVCIISIPLDLQLTMQYHCEKTFKRNCRCITFPPKYATCNAMLSLDKLQNKCLFSSMQLAIQCHCEKRSRRKHNTSFLCNYYSSCDKTFWDKLMESRTYFYFSQCNVNSFAIQTCNEFLLYVCIASFEKQIALCMVTLP